MSADHTTCVDTTYLASRARREALRMDESAALHRFYEMNATADLEAGWSARLREFAALCEFAPFEVDFPPVSLHRLLTS